MSFYMPKISQNLQNYFLIILGLLSLYSPLTILSTRTRERVIEMLRPLSITTFNKRVWHSPKYVPDVCE